MQDRVSQYPGRVKLTPVSGQENVYDMEWADGATTEGTPLNKANLLSDSTASAFGLNQTSGTVNEALNLLSDAALVGERRYSLEGGSIIGENVFSGDGSNLHSISGPNGPNLYYISRISNYVECGGKIYATAVVETSDGDATNIHIVASDNGITWADIGVGTTTITNIRSNLIAYQDRYICYAYGTSHVKIIDTETLSDVSKNIGVAYPSNEGIFLGVVGDYIVASGPDSSGTVFVKRSNDLGETWLNATSGTLNEKVSYITSGAYLAGHYAAYVYRNPEEGVYKIFYTTSTTASNWNYKALYSQMDETIAAYISGSPNDNYYFLTQGDEFISVSASLGSANIASHDWDDNDDGAKFGVIQAVAYNQEDGYRYILRFNVSEDRIFLYRGILSFSYVGSFYAGSVSSYTGIFSHKNTLIFAGNGSFKAIIIGRELKTIDGDVISTLSLEGQYRIQSAEQTITDLELTTIEQGQQMTDLELMILEGYHV